MALFAAGMKAAAAAAAAGEVVTMSPVKVHAGLHEFVPTWVFDAKPPRLILQLADRVRLRQPTIKWLIPPELGFRHGDEILSVNNKRVGDAGFIELWRSVLTEGTHLSIELKPAGTSRSQKVEYTLRLTRPAAEAARKK